MTLIVKFKNSFVYGFILLFFITFYAITNNNFLSNQSDTKQLLFKDDKVKCALFTSQHDIANMLIELINNEKKSIRAAIYLLFHKEIAQALIRAKQERGVIIKIVTDLQSFKHKFSKMPLILKSNIEIHTFGAKDPKEFMQPLMHNKFFIFEQNIDNRAIVWTGSFNCTKNAQAQNKENVIILDDQHIIDLYKQEFEILKKHSKLQVNNRFKENFSLNKQKNKHSKKIPSRDPLKLNSAQDFLKSMQIKI